MFIKTFISFLISCIHVLWSKVRWVLKSLSIVIDLSVSSCNSNAFLSLILFFFFSFKFYFIIIIFYFTILYWFAIHQHASTTSVHVFPVLNPPHLPPHPIPLGHPSAPAVSTLSHASNLDWRFISYMILYMFQCHSPKSSPLPLPQSPKDCSIHLCLFCCLAYRVIVTIFLNSIYMH